MTGRRSQPDPSDETTQAAYYGQQNSSPPKGQQTHHQPQGDRYPQGGQQQHGGQQQQGYPPPGQPAQAGQPGQGVGQPAPTKRKKWPWIVGGLVLFIIIVASCNSGNSADTGSSGPNAPAGSPAPAAPSTEAGAKTAAKYGQPLKADDLTLTVAPPKKSSNQFTGSQVCANVTYQNGGSTPQSFNLFDWKFRTSEGVEASAGIPFSGGKALNSGQLRAGGKVSGLVCSDNTVEEASEIVYQPGFGFSDPLVWSK